jgi:hypothetical protein
VKQLILGHAYDEYFVLAKKSGMTIASHSSLGLCLMSSLPKGERLCTKLVELLLTGWLREET